MPPAIGFARGAPGPDAKLLTRLRVPQGSVGARLSAEEADREQNSANCPGNQDEDIGPVERGSEKPGLHCPERKWLIGKTRPTHNSTHIEGVLSAQFRCW